MTGAAYSFACWFWDFDNDGRLDLYVNDYRARIAEVLPTAMGVKIEGSSRPGSTAISGSGGFRGRHGAVGLDRAMAPWAQFRRHRQRWLSRHLPGHRRHVV